MWTLSVKEHVFAFLIGFDKLKNFPKFGSKQSFNFINIILVVEKNVQLNLYYSETAYVFFRDVLYIEIHAKNLVALV